MGALVFFHPVGRRDGRWSISMLRPFGPLFKLDAPAKFNVARLTSRGIDTGQLEQLHTLLNLHHSRSAVRSHDDCNTWRTTMVLSSIAPHTSALAVIVVAVIW